MKVTIDSPEDGTTVPSLQVTVSGTIEDPDGLDLTPSDFQASTWDSWDIWYYDGRRYCGRVVWRN